LANWEKVVFLLKTQYYYPVFAKLEAFWAKNTNVSPILRQLYFLKNKFLSMNVNKSIF
jgi:hypothetical protein